MCGVKKKKLELAGSREKKEGETEIERQREWEINQSSRPRPNNVHPLSIFTNHLAGLMWGRGKAWRGGGIYLFFYTN